jgi:pantetheine-phosphate adenylyltransferase
MSQLGCQHNYLIAYAVDVLYLDDALLRNKSNRDALESLEQRMNSVRDFLQLFRPQIEHYVLPISDVYGPTATDPDIHALVVSKETMNGANASTYCKFLILSAGTL